MKRVLPCLSLLIACSGVSALPTKTAFKVIHSRVAAGFYARNKQIVYVENLTTIVGSAWRERTGTFAGLSDVDAELSHVLVAELRSMGFDSVGLDETLETDEQNSELSRVVQTQQLSHKTDWRALQLPKALAAALLARGVRYLLLWRVPAYRVVTNGTQGNLVLPGDLFIFDVDHGMRIYGEWIAGNEVFHYQDSMREIEADDFKQLRQLSANALIKATRGPLARMLRIVPSSESGDQNAVPTSGVSREQAAHETPSPPSNDRQRSARLRKATVLFPTYGLAVFAGGGGLTLKKRIRDRDKIGSPRGFAMGLNASVWRYLSVDAGFAMVEALDRAPFQETACPLSGGSCESGPSQISGFMGYAKAGPQLKVVVPIEDSALEVTLRAGVGFRGFSLWRAAHSDCSDCKVDPIGALGGAYLSPEVEVGYYASDVLSDLGWVFGLRATYERYLSGDASEGFWLGAVGEALW